MSVIAFALLMTSFPTMPMPETVYRFEVIIIVDKRMKTIT